MDVVGGVLLAVALGLATWGLYNPAPDGKHVLPSYGLPLLVGALVAAVAFFVWERVASTRLIEPAGVHFRPFLAALGASLTAGAALMVTLVNVELFGQGVLGLDKNSAAGLLLRFLIALPIGALLGGWIATKIGDRIVAFAGLLIAAGGYWLIAKWPVDVLAARHDLGLFTLPTLDTDLAIAGLGLGLVIGPLTSATLRVVPAAQHGIASAAVVVARMIGMLVGIAALSAWGLYRFNQHLASLPSAGGQQPDGAACRTGLAAHPARPTSMQYGEIFTITAIVCVVGALLGLLISGRHEHADEPAPTVDADDTPTALIDAPTRAERSGNHRRSRRCKSNRRRRAATAPARRSAALDSPANQRGLLDLCRLVGGQAPPRIADECLEAFGIYGSNTEPVLQCSHARCPLLVLTRRATSSVKALWYECTGGQRPDWLLATPGTRAKANNSRGENSCQLH